jgi:FLVCR family MFS transporter 7
VVLAVYFALTVVIEIQWLTFAPIAREARIAYGVSAFWIDFLSIVYMGLTMLLCLPASYFIDRVGIRVGIGLGAVLTGVFGLAKGLFSESYAMVLAAQILLGLAQPFIINAVTAVAANWFPEEERATAVGIGTLAQFVGFIVANMVTPHLIRQVGTSYDLHSMLMIYGVASVLAAVAFLVFMREKPPIPPSARVAEQRLGMKDALRHMFRQRDVVMLVILFWLGLGMFNAVTTCIDQIGEAKGLTSAQSGAVMGGMFLAGIVGALIVPPISDRLRKRKPFMVGATALLIPGIAGMAFLHSFGPLLAAAIVVGFFLLGAAGPIGFQYGAEVSQPAPEALSQGIVLLSGQLSGILFIVIMNAVGMGPSMIAFVGVSLITLVLATRLRESPVAVSRRDARG